MQASYRLPTLSQDAAAKDFSGRRGEQPTTKRQTARLSPTPGHEVISLRRQGCMVRQR